MVCVWSAAMEFSSWPPGFLELTRQDMMTWQDMMVCLDMTGAGSHGGPGGILKFAWAGNSRFHCGFTAKI